MNVLYYIIPIFIPIILIIIPIIVIVKKTIRKNKRINNMMINKIKERDENFDFEIFKKIIKSYLINISLSLLKCNSSRLMSIETESMFENDSALINKFFTEDLATVESFEKIENISLVDYKIINGFEHIYCKARVATRKITVIPSKNKIVKVDELYTLCWKYIDVLRSTKILSNNDLKNINKCPNCGSELEINNLGRCIYCRSYIINGSTNWAINRISNFVYYGDNN